MLGSRLCRDARKWAGNKALFPGEPLPRRASHRATCRGAPEFTPPLQKPPTGEPGAVAIAILWKNRAPAQKCPVEKLMTELPTWLIFALATAALVAVLLGLRVASVRRQRTALDAARHLAEQRQQQAALHQRLAQAQTQALAQVQAQAQALAHSQALAATQRRQADAAARQQAQAALLAQREATAAEREARRRAADDAARQHAQVLIDKRQAERAAEAAARTRPAGAGIPGAAAKPATARTPVPLAARPAPGAAAAAAPVARTDTVVLVADDSKVVRVKLGRLLAQHGFQVMLAEDGLEALRQMQLQVPHVLLTDAEMPGLDGLELTRRVRSQPQLAHIMVLMISSADSSLGSAASAAGVTALLGKPYAEDRLLALLDSVRRPAVSAATTGATGATVTAAATARAATAAIAATAT